MADIVYPNQPVSQVVGADEMPDNVDIMIYKGDAKEFLIELRDEDGNAISLVGYTPKAQIRDNYDGPVVVEFATSVTSDGSDIRIYLSSAKSSTLEVGKNYIWDVQLTDFRGDVHTFLTGDVEVMAEVTE